MQRSRRLTYLAVGVGFISLPLLLCSCDGYRMKSRAIRPPDSWEIDPGNDALLDWQRVPASDLVEVPGPGLQNAIELLRDKGVMLLTANELSKLGVTQDSDRQDRKPHLIRGVKFVASRGGFGAYIHGKAIWIRQGMLTSDPPPVEKAPVVVWLPFTPSTVYVGVIAAR
jgi:hypothetical protein